MEKQEWNPGRLLQLSGQYWATCTLHAAVKLDVFTVIGEKQIADMLAKAGVKEIQRISFKGPNDSGIISGVV